MSRKEYDRGSTVVIEVEFKRYDPFGEYAYFDPWVYTITITDPEGTVKINAVNLIQKTTGKYYYRLQTLTDWEIGTYIVKVNSQDVEVSFWSDVTIDPESFYLK
jgi:hypothetical protein